MSTSTTNARLEAFSDGVFAIALTLLIIDIKIPPTTEIHTTAEFWIALRHMLPSISAFVLSFVIILITWVNHHNGSRLLTHSTGSLIYANGLLLLTVVFLPFPTSLMGEYIMTDHAAPAVILYDGLLTLQALSWVLILNSGINHQLVKNEIALAQMHLNRRSAYFAIVVYTLLTILAFWFPLPVAIITTLTWIFWLIFGINMKHE